MDKKIKGLYVVINTEKKFKYSSLELAKMACQGGADFIQLRDKREFDKDRIELANEISTICHDFQVPFIVNDRLDIALLVGAAGVHLGQQDVSPSWVKKTMKKSLIIGGTVSSLKEAKAIEPYCDYISLGHIYPTLTKKKNYLPLGIETIKIVKKSINLPLVCIGGIDHSRVQPVINAGADAIAVVRAVCESDYPKEACITLRKAIAGSS